MKKDEKPSLTRTTIQIEANLWFSFKNYVLAKYGSIKGYLWFEVSRALEAYLQSAHTHEFQHTNLPDNMSSKVDKRHINFLVEFAKRYQQEVTLDAIEALISDMCGIDSRTKRKYLQFLTEHGFIRHKKALYNRNAIYDVNYQRIFNFLKKHISEQELTAKGIPQPKPEAVTSNPNNGDRIPLKEEIKAFVKDRYEAGDSMEEIREKLADFGFELSKKAVRNFLRGGVE